VSATFREINQDSMDFTQKTFVFLAPDTGAVLGVRVRNRLVDAIARWATINRVVLRGINPFTVPDVSMASLARVEQFLPELLDPETGAFGTLPPGAESAFIEEHALVVLVYGDHTTGDLPRQRVMIFSDWQYSFRDRASGKILANRIIGHIASDLKNWANANRVRLPDGSCGGPIWISGGQEAAFESLDQARLINPATGKLEPIRVDPESVQVVAYQRMMMVYGTEVGDDGRTDGKSDGRGDGNRAAGEAGAPGSTVRPAPAADVAVEPTDIFGRRA
jgi:hypothetical protein